MPAPELEGEDLSQDKLLWHLRRSAFGRPMLSGIPLIRRLGKGAMGAVYFAHHPRLEIDVAIKILPYTLVEDEPQLLDRFQSEGRLAAQIKSDHLVRVLDVNRDGETHFIVMEYVNGESAKAFLRRVGKPGVPEREALDVVTAACKGLAAAHAAGIIHRDLKPDNILIPNGQLAKAKLADLGLAKPQWDEKTIGTKSHVLLGTPGFMAPEQIQDSRTAGMPADVFGMGATLYMLLMGHAPYTGETLMKVVASTLQKDPIPLSPSINPSITAIVNRCLDRDPRKRYRDAGELLGALEKAETGSKFTTAILDFKDPDPPVMPPTLSTLPDASQLPAPPPPAPGPAPAKSSSWPMVAVIALVAVGCGGLWWYLSAARERAWLAAKAAADIVDLDKVQSAREWSDRLATLERAAAFGMDPTLPGRVERCRARFDEAAQWETFQASAHGAKLQTGEGLMRMHPNGLHFREVTAAMEILRAACNAEWETVHDKAVSLRAGKLADALDLIDKFAARFAGTTYEERARDLVKGWIEEDWAKASAEAARLAEQESYLEAAAVMKRFVDLAHGGGDHQRQAEDRLGIYLWESGENLEAILSASYSVVGWAEGCLAFRDGRYREAIDAWRPIGQGIPDVPWLIRHALMRLADQALRAPTKAAVDEVMAAIAVVETLPAWPRLKKVKDRVERENIPDEARTAWVQAQALAMLAGNDADKWMAVVERYEIARPGLIANPWRRDEANKAADGAKARLLELTKRELENLLGGGGWDNHAPSVRQAIVAVQRGLRFAPADKDFLAAHDKIQAARAFAPVFGWVDLVRALAETPLAVRRLELLAAYPSKANPPFPDEFQTAWTRTEQEAFNEVAANGDLAQAERFAAISKRGPELLAALRADVGYRDSLQRANKHLEARAWREAMTAFEEILKTKPKDAAALAGHHTARDAFARDPANWVELQNTAGAHSGAVRALTWSPDSEWLASASEDDTVKVWDHAGRHSRTHTGHTKDVIGVGWRTSGEVVSADEGSIRIWRATPQELKVASVRAFAADGTTIAIGQEKSIVLLNDSGKRLDGHADTVSALAIQRSGDLLASGGWDGAIILWDARKGTHSGKLGAHTKPVLSLAFSGDGRFLVSNGRDGVVQLWDVGKQVLAGTIKVQAGPVTLNHDGSLLAAAGSGWVRVWSADGKEARSYTGLPGVVWSVAFSPDGKRLASGSMDGSIKIWGAKR